MEKFDIRSLKLIGLFILVILIFIVFLGVISNAYKNLPEDRKFVAENVINEDSLGEQEENSTEGDLSEEETIALRERTERERLEQERYERERLEREQLELQRHEERARMIEKKRAEALKRRENLKPLESIKSPQNDDAEGIVNENISEQEKMTRILESAITAQNEKKYDKSNELFFSLIEISNDKFVSIDCYDQIAKNYIALDDYESALEYAKKAYELGPTQARKILLAKISYKMGDTSYSESIYEEMMNSAFEQK